MITKTLSQLRTDASPDAADHETLVFKSPYFAVERERQRRLAERGRAELADALRIFVACVIEAERAA